MEDLKRYDLGIWRMKPNPVLSKIKNGELTIGAEQRWFIHGIDMNFIGYLAQAGYDFVVIDTEHTPWYGLEACATAVIAAEAAGIVPFIRVSDPNPGLITKALDMGAYGVWIPHVDTKDDAREAVAAAKYNLPGWEFGARGQSSDFRADGYGAYNTPDLALPYQDLEKWQKFSNEETMVTALPLESKQGIDNIEQIISVKGLSMVSLSVGDITQCLGHPGQPDHPEVMQVRDRICDLCMEKRMPVYLPVGPNSPKLVKHYYDKGVRVFYGTPNIRQHFKDTMAKMREICK